MKKFKRSEVAILPLVLKGKWYDMIASGEKKEEYREVKPYWKKRILKWLYSPKEIHVVAFSRGYRKPDMFFHAATSWNTHIGGEHPNWGEPDKEHYIIHLFERVELDMLEGRQKLGGPKEALPPCACGGEAATVERGTEPEGFAIMRSRCFRKTALHPSLALAEEEWRTMLATNNTTTKENN